MSWEAVAAIASILLALGAIAAVFTQAARNAEDRGRLLQRVDDMERRMRDQEKRSECAEGNHSDSSVKIAEQAAAIEYIKDQLDALTRSVSDLTHAVQDLVARTAR